MERRIIALSTFIVLCLPNVVLAQEQPLTRREGFLQMWESIKRPAEPAKTRFSDVPEPARGSLEIDYAASRGIINDDDSLFYPDDPLILTQALVWLFRTRNVTDDPAHVTVETLQEVLDRYPIAHIDGTASQKVTRTMLDRLITSLDTELREEIHEVSLYAEKWHGQGTAFGEAFDMNALTAAHRSFPYNTIVKVTNIDNGKSVTVRINDRGPFIKGRDMDLSLASFTTIAERSKGKINTRFERLGDARLVDQSALPKDQESSVATQIVTKCESAVSMQRRIGGGAVLTPGIPRQLALNSSISLKSNRDILVRSIKYPDGTVNTLQNFVLKHDQFEFKPSVTGTYSFLIGPATKRSRWLKMDVIECT